MVTLQRAAFSLWRWRISPFPAYSTSAPYNTSQLFMYAAHALLIAYGLCCGYFYLRCICRRSLYSCGCTRVASRERLASSRIPLLPRFVRGETKRATRVLLAPSVFSNAPSRHGTRMIVRDVALPHGICRSPFCLHFAPQRWVAGLTPGKRLVLLRIL